MISLRRPLPERVESLLAAHADAPFSYEPLGLTRESIPSTWTVDRNEVALGRGEACWLAACSAMRELTPFAMPWVHAHFPRGLAAGAPAAVVARAAGLWWTNLCRILEVHDEPLRFGFTYGTLGPHAARGEERFLLHREGEGGTVRYEILAASRPRHPLMRLGYPLARARQRAFARASLAAMVAATTGP